LSGKGTGILTLSPIRYIGRISYTIYLIHFTVLILAARYLHGALTIAGVTLAVTVLYAAISWVLLEKPLLTRRRQPSEKSTLV
jgi:peptidoglycan/LPS O-acetylase OafA/YrhL